MEKELSKYEIGKELLLEYSKSTTDKNPFSWSMVEYNIWIKEKLSNNQN